MEFRDVFGIPTNDLKISPIWLGKFKARHIIACHNLCGESSDVDAHGVGVSQARLPTKLQYMMSRTFSILMRRACIIRHLL